MDVVSSPAEAETAASGLDLRWLMAASYGTWLVCAVPPIAEIAAGRFSGWPAVAWAVSYLLFGAAQAWIVCASGSGRYGQTIRVYLLAAQSITGLVAVALSRNGVTSALLVIVAAQLPHMLPLRRSAIWIGSQSFVNAVIIGRHNWINGVTGGIAIGGFQLFAMASSVLAARERDARRKLAAAHAEVLATRARLAESSRVEERLRIARDLHDALGHHLTALSLQLDVASRLAEGKAAAHVAEAHAITRLLLGDVRDVVGQLRDRPRAPLDDALRALAASSRDVAVQLTLPPSLPRGGEPRDEALLRAVQEIITNAVRHSGARNLWIEIGVRTDGIELHARDDGRGVAALTPGLGLTGMRERFEACGGRVEFTTRPGQGFDVRGFIPNPRDAP